MQEQNSNNNQALVDQGKDASNNTPKFEYSVNKKSFTILVALVLVAFFAFVSYNLWNFGTVKIGNYYINAWQPAVNNEPYFHFGKSDRVNAIESLFENENKTEGNEDIVSERIGRDENPTYNTGQWLSRREINQIVDLNFPHGWIFNDMNAFQNRLRRYCNEFDLDQSASNCIEDPTQEEYNKDSDGVVWGYFEVVGFCDKFGDLLPEKIPCVGFKDLGLITFVRLKDLLLPEVKLSRDTECAPADLRNREPAQTFNITASNQSRFGLVQRSKTFCLYESYGSSGNLPSHLDYYIPLSANNEVLKYLLHIQFSYIEQSEEALQELEKFENMIRTAVIK